MSLCHIIPFCNLWILNIVCLPPFAYHWVCVLYSTHILRNTHFMEEHILCWTSKHFAHFGNRCQWGRSLESFVEKFRELFLHALVLFLSICITCSCIISCCFAWWCLIPYINSLESDCHQLPKWGRLKEHVLPPCLVLVIDDNLYGLMVALSYIWRVCP